MSGTQLDALRHKDIVLVVKLEEDLQHGQRALVIPPAPQSPGWISLEASGNDVPIGRKPLDGSWEMKAMYCVNHPATLRQGSSLKSDWVGEVRTGDEVLVLELGISTEEEVEDPEHKPRLRALVSVHDLIGWLSPETASGIKLLDQVNLLSDKVVDVHRKSLARASTGGSAGPRRSLMGGGDVPWSVGGQYRLLETAVLREGNSLSSRELGKVSAGALLTIKDIHNSQCPALGWCPCAFVTVADGPESGREGWVRCASDRGHDVVDIRDNLAYEKVIHKLRMSTTGDLDGAIKAQADTTSERNSEDTGEATDSDPGASEEEPSKVSLQELRTMKEEDKLMDVSLAKFEPLGSDDRLIQDRHEIDDSCCECTCAGGRPTSRFS